MNHLRNAVGSFLIASLAIAAWDGNPGRDGESISITADGSVQRYNLSGGNGGNGGNGRDGRDAICQPTGGPYNVNQPNGDSGERGGNGGRGGDAGGLTVYYEDLANLKNIQVISVAGSGGYPGRGGRGGRGCSCPQFSWKIGDISYYCTPSRDGYSGSDGSFGTRGYYRRIFIINRLTPVPPELPKAYVEMSQMESKVLTLSENHWEERKGTASLFAAGSRLMDSHLFFTGRTEVKYAFRWQASRPLEEFKNWQMYAYLDGENVKVNFPSNLIVKSSSAMEGDVQIFTIHSVVRNDELFNLSFQGLSGKDADLAIEILDRAKVSDLVETSASLTFSTYEKGQYKPRFKDQVPAEALVATKNGFSVKVGSLGIDPQFLTGGTQVHIYLTVKRTFEGKSVTRYFSQVDKIALIQSGMLIEVLSDANLYTGNQVVGKVLKGEQYTVVKIQSDWVSLAKADGTVLPGWIQRTKIRPVSLTN